jgi:hypothetical protein
MNIKRIATALLTAATLVVPLAGQAQAATTKVEIVNKSSGRVITWGPSYVTAQPSDPSMKLRTWIKVDVAADQAIYRWAKNETLCLTGLPASNQMTVQTCNGGFRQLWATGFTGGTFRKFENVGTLRAATQKPFRNGDGTARTPVEQEVFIGENAQLWQVRPA